MNEPRTAPGDPGPSLGDLFRALAADASTLIKQEMALARAEMRQNVRSAVRDMGGAAAGAAVALVGLLVLVVAVIAFLGDIMGGRYALAALIVAVVMLGGGAFLVLRGAKSFRQAQVAPEAAMAALRETGDWAKLEAADFREAISTGEVHRRMTHLTLVRDGQDGGSSDTGGRRGGSGDASKDGTPGTAAARGQRRDREMGRGEAERPGRAGVKGGKPRPDQKGELPVTAPLWKRVFHDYSRNRLPDEAAKVTYYFFMSLPPALMAIFSLTGIFGGHDTAEWLSTHLSQSLPGEARDLVQGFVKDVVYKKAPGPLTIGLVLALWSAAGVMMALEDSLNDAYEITVERGFVKRRLVALGTMVACALLFVAGSAALLAGPKLADAAGLGEVGQTVWSIVQWPLSFLLVVGAFWIMYYVLPNRDQSECKGVLFKSAAIAAAAWLLATIGFRLYVSHFGSYSKTYGVLGGIIVLLLWLYYTSLVILLGGELSSEMERKKA